MSVNVPTFNRIESRHEISKHEQATKKPTKYNVTLNVEHHYCIATSHINTPGIIYFDFAIPKPASNA